MDTVANTSLFPQFTTSQKKKKRKKTWEMFTVLAVAARPTPALGQECLFYTYHSTIARSDVSVPTIWACCTRWQSRFSRWTSPSTRRSFPSRSTKPRFPLSRLSPPPCSAAGGTFSSAMLWCQSMRANWPMATQLPWQRGVQESDPDAGYERGKNAAKNRCRQNC